MSTDHPHWLSLVREKVETLRYGVVQIVVHDSKVTQIERTERTRILRPANEFFPDRPDKLEETQPREASHQTDGRRF